MTTVLTNLISFGLSKVVLSATQRPHFVTPIFEMFIGSVTFQRLGSPVRKRVVVVVAFVLFCLLLVLLF